jgi:hypothetical protein
MGAWARLELGLSVFPALTTPGVLCESSLVEELTVPLDPIRAKAVLYYWHYSAYIGRMRVACPLPTYGAWVINNEVWGNGGKPAAYTIKQGVKFIASRSFMKLSSRPYLHGDGYLLRQGRRDITCCLPSH